MLQIKRLHIKCSVQRAAVLHPKKWNSILIFCRMNSFCGDFEIISAHHMAVQSKCTINHLDGLNAIESAFSMPFSQTRYSGQMNALPAYAASTCSQTLSSLQMSPICVRAKTNPATMSNTSNTSNWLRQQFHSISNIFADDVLPLLIYRMHRRPLFQV